MSFFYIFTPYVRKQDTADEKKRRNFRTPDKQLIVDVSHLGTDIGELEGLDELGSVIRVFESLQMGEIGRAHV